ncbi:5'-3' exonuclease family protein [Carex rostrata]
MGIPNLLRVMKPFIEPVHIKKYSGRRVGIDAYSWLHKGAYSCSLELCMKPRTEAAKRYLNYFMHYINLMRHYSVTPIVVFDGGNLPCKSDTEAERHKRREANLAIAKEKLCEGDVGGAIEYFKKAVHVTPPMAHQLIQILRLERVEFLVAPYEADAQLAYLSSLEEERGGISAIITEDSDLIAYGCPAIIFKMDRHGNGDEFLLDKAFNIVTKELSFKGLDKNLFTGMCVLAGCDFLPSIHGIGVRRAYSLVSKHRNLDRVLSVLKLDKRYTVPDNYEDSFFKALSVFNHATIYDAETKSLKPLKPLGDGNTQYLIGDLSILGPDISPKIATGIAEGFLNPVTKEAFNLIPSPRKGIKNAKISILDSTKENYIQISPMGGPYTSIFSSESTTQDMRVVEDEISNEIYMKDTFALGKLVTEESEQKVSETMNGSEGEIRIPDNNPFKKRKIEVRKEKENSASISTADFAFAEQSVVVNSTPVSQESVGSKPKEVLNNSKGKTAKKDVNAKVGKGKCGKKNQDEKRGILNFFFRL